MTFSIRVDAGPFLSFIDQLGEDAEKAIALGINRTVEDGYAVIRRHVKDRFTVRTLPLNFVAPQFIPAGDRAKPGRLFVVMEPEGVGKILEPFEEGLTHGRDRLGRAVAVPSTGFLGLRSSPRTVIPRKLYPANLGLQVVRDAKANLLYYNTGRGAKKRGITGKPPSKGRYGTYTATDKQGRTLIFQRTGPGTSRLLWLLTDQVPRPASLHYRDDVQQTVDNRWALNMMGAWDFYEAKAARRAR